jgi:hypothetical protein
MIPIKGLSALAAATAFLFWISFLVNKPSTTVASLLVIGAGLESMAVFCGLWWAISKSNTAFYSIFVGDALVRLAGLGLAAYWLCSHQMAYTMPLITLGLCYLLLPLVQIPFFPKAA